jgi:hypothetical protein
VSRVKVQVVKSQCEQLASLIKSLKLPPAEEEPIRHDIRDDTIKNAYLSIVAICHQTTPHSGPRLEGLIDGKLAIGWDYLLKRWLKNVEEDPSIAQPERLAQITATDIQSLFKDETHGSLLTDVSGRASLLNDIGKVMLRLNITDVQDVYDECGGWLRGESNAPGILESLRRFRAYDEDPVQKKTFYFLALMQNQGIWKYRDEANLAAPVDYHEVRGHLRYGTVSIIDSDLRQKLLRRQAVAAADDVEIRSAVFEAILQIAQLTGETPNNLHYFFWNMFRNCCRRDETHCVTCKTHPSLPQRYSDIKNGKCIFSSSCASVDEDSKLLDHLVTTTFY